MSSEYSGYLDRIKVFINGAPKYKDVLTRPRTIGKFSIIIELADLRKFDDDLAGELYLNPLRFLQHFNEAFDLIAFKTQPLPKDRFRLYNRLAKHGQTNYPPELFRNFEIYFKPESSVGFSKELEKLLSKKIIYCRLVEGLSRPITISDLNSNFIGKMVTIRARVRGLENHNQIILAGYRCQRCPFYTFHRSNLNQMEYTHPSICKLVQCKELQNKTKTDTPPRLDFDREMSKFIGCQVINLEELQETNSEIQMTKSIKVFAYGTLKNICSIGDSVLISGILLPVPEKERGYKKRVIDGPVTMLAHNIIRLDENTHVCDHHQRLKEITEVIFRDKDTILNKLTRSLAPEIFGHEKLKEVLLLQLVGGLDYKDCSQRSKIHICLMGDPGTAKSQLIRLISLLPKRSILTNGSGTSDVGLTASVSKHNVTGQFFITPGALILADGGICCIDEFDKMRDDDKVALHEAMEQQTVSIAKADIQITLNARISILSAANPTDGSYNYEKSVSENLKLPSSLISRFDLMWLVKDEPSYEVDFNLAEHVTRTHREYQKDSSDVLSDLSLDDLRIYLDHCQGLKPIFPESIDELLIKAYTDRRDKKRFEGGNKEEESLFITTRAALSLIRLASAYAKLRMADRIEVRDVNSAILAMECSQRLDTINNDFFSIIEHLTRSESGEYTKLSLQSALLEKRIPIRDFDLWFRDLDRSGIIKIDEDLEKFTIVGMINA